MSKSGAKTMLNAPVKKSHSFMVSSVFKVSETADKYYCSQLAPADNRNYTYQGGTFAITCSGWDPDNKREYDGDLGVYCSAMELPMDIYCYAIKAKMFPQPDTADYKLYFESNHRISVGTSDTFAGKLHNTSASLCDNVDFAVKYHISPTIKMKRSQAIIQDGKEALVHGFIVDWDNNTHRWIVECPTNTKDPGIMAINVATGHKQATKKHQAAGTKVTPTGRVRPANTYFGCCMTRSKTDCPTPNVHLTTSASAIAKGKKRAPPPEEEGYFDNDRNVVMSPPQDPVPGPSGSKQAPAGRQAKRSKKV
ncbi:uncharacterized protein MELLADRAFT_103256 [Melampsora larici-populina 98AG31]|uniref:Uncharacterized protein n=1 Tax=Melampsora larici-populina (strain 98AG31 / pathotype 3-4-7) TaxID=747676 RepID=F4R9S9_MELLP|nr:uncharacterized protein MELLADRAFT_103256 [Melampsora larici-populina 98AG31]EGG10575.1 hypothetical protein MELLADRAFT_103256 [Melampsora larici-populina 98AG31]